MSRPNLVHPEQPVPLRAVLHMFQFAASLKLAVVLILSSAFTFACGTFVEARYGTPVAQFGVYQTWWFNLLVALLATNIFCAAAIRYPWKRHQTGFVITHIGLLTLLFGTALSRMWGIDAQILVWEYQSSGWALKDDALHLSMAIHKDEDASDAELRRIPTDVDNDDTLEKIPPIAFRPGPFSWRDYREAFWLTSMPDEVDENIPWWHFWRRLHAFRYACGKMFSIARLGRTHAGDVLYDKDGILLEVRDFYADSEPVDAPLVRLSVTTPRTERTTAEGRTVKSRHIWTPLDLTVDKLRHDVPADYPHGASVAKGRRAGGSYAFMITDDPTRRQAFLACGPEGEIGERGQVVLFVDGKPRRFYVHEKIDAGRFAIDGTPWEVELKEYWPAAQPGFREETGQYEASPMPGEEGTISPTVELRLFKNDQPAGRLVLFADQPNLSIHDHKHQIYGDYWFDHGDLQEDKDRRMRHGIGNRIDILQVQDENAAGKEDEFQLYFRRWDKKAVVDSGELPSDGSPETVLDAFAVGDQIKFYVRQHVPAPSPQSVTLPVKFEKGKVLGRRRPAAKLRLTVDGKSEEFWLEAYKGDPDFSPRSESAHRIVGEKDRRVAVKLPIDAVDIGFRVRLNDFQRRLDPGTSQPSHYSSTIDILDRNFDRKIVSASLDGSSIEQVEFPLVLAHDTTFTADTARITKDGKYLYWLSYGSNTIERIQLGDEKAMPKTVVGGAHIPIRPVAFAIDGDTLFWAEYVPTRSGVQARIRKADADGSNEQTLAAFPNKPTGLAVDPVGEIVYWTYRKRVGRDESPTGGLGRVTYDGNDQRDDLLARSHDGVPASIAVDPIGERLYWTEPDRGLIRTANLDGGDVRKISLTGMQRPDSVAVDPQAGRLYWADLREAEEASEIETPTQSDLRHRIWTAGLKGEDPILLAEQRIDAPRGLALTGDGERLIWTQEAVLKHNVWITMNAPVEFANPQTGQSYRLFQESFDGPYEPGTQEYAAFVPDGVDGDELYLSVLTVNYDPGRFIRNTGCLIVVLGIATMFYMRAYFFRRPSPREERQSTTAEGIRRRPRETMTPSAPATNGRQRSKDKGKTSEVVDAKVVK